MDFLKDFDNLLVAAGVLLLVASIVAPIQTKWFTFAASKLQRWLMAGLGLTLASVAVITHTKVEIALGEKCGSVPAAAGEVSVRFPELKRVSSDPIAQSSEPFFGSRATVLCAISEPNRTLLIHAETKRAPPGLRYDVSVVESNNGPFRRNFPNADQRAYDFRVAPPLPKTVLIIVSRRDNSEEEANLAFRISSE